MLVPFITLSTLTSNVEVRFAGSSTTFFLHQSEGVRVHVNNAVHRMISTKECTKQAILIPPPILPIPMAVQVKVTAALGQTVI